MKRDHNGEEMYEPNPSFDFHHPVHLSGALKDLITTFFTDFPHPLHSLLCLDHQPTGYCFKGTSLGWGVGGCSHQRPLLPS